jgi:hypothetical protein
MIPAPFAGAAVIRVPDHQPTIQAGIDAAMDGDTVMVAPGIYEGDGNRDMSFGGKAITVRSEYGQAGCVIACGGFADQGHRAFHFNSGEGPDSVLEGFTITGGYLQGFSGAAGTGGALLVEHASPTIRGNRIMWNSAGGGDVSQYGGGGGIAVIGDGSPLILANQFLFNHVEGLFANGGGIASIDASPRIENNLFHENVSLSWGGGIFTSGGAPVIGNCTFSDCRSTYGGGGLFALSGEVLIVNSIFWDNWEGGISEAIEMGFPPDYQPTVTIRYSCIEYGQSSVDVVAGKLTWGAGMISDHPYFRSGPAGAFYLAQQATGHTQQSPCVDAGDPESPPVEGTTRTDHGPDEGIVDMGWHAPVALSVAQLITGPGPSPDNPPEVKVFDPVGGATANHQFTAYGADSWGVNVATGDLDEDGMAEIITGAGPGAIFGPHVRAFRVTGDLTCGVNFLAYGTNKYGVNVAAGDLDGDEMDEIVTGAGPGAVFGPHVRGWDVDDWLAEPMPGVSYFAYGTLKYGVNVAAGDIDGDGYDEILTGAGPGAIFGPHVRGWNVDGGSAAAMPGVSFFAYGTLKYGVNVGAGDVDGDGIDEILTAPGPSPHFASHIRGWNAAGGFVTPLPGCSFFAWAADLPRHGARVASGVDLDGDGTQEIIVGAGPDPSIGSPVRVFHYLEGEVSEAFSLEAYPQGWSHGVNAAAGLFR